MVVSSLSKPEAYCTPESVRKLTKCTFGIGVTLYGALALIFSMFNFIMLRCKSASGLFSFPPPAEYMLVGGFRRLRGLIDADDGRPLRALVHDSAHHVCRRLVIGLDRARVQVQTHRCAGMSQTVLTVFIPTPLPRSKAAEICRCSCMLRSVRPITDKARKPRRLQPTRAM